MGTEVLRSHDCLQGRLHLDAFRQFPTGAVKPCRKKFGRSPTRSNPKKSTRADLARSDRRVSFAGEDPAIVVKFPSRNFVMEEVTILKRGADLKPSVVDRESDSQDAVLCSTDRIGPDPETLPRQIRFSGSPLSSPPPKYAGPGFSSSPPPSSLPFPALLVKNRDDMATRGLRCLLRLDDLP